MPKPNFSPWKLFLTPLLLFEFFFSLWVEYSNEKTQKVAPLGTCRNPWCTLRTTVHRHKPVRRWHRHCWRASRQDLGQVLSGKSCEVRFRRCWPWPSYCQGNRQPPWGRYCSREHWGKGKCVPHIDSVKMKVSHLVLMNRC